MLNPDMLIKMAAGEVEEPSLFPYPMSLHIIFVCIAVIFFIYRYISDGKPYQLIFTLAIPFSLTLHVFPENRTWFYIVAVVEVVMLLCALGSAMLWKSSEKDEKKAPETDGKAEEEA